MYLPSVLRDIFFITKLWLEISSPRKPKNSEILTWDTWFTWSFHLTRCHMLLCAIGSLFETCFLFLGVDFSNMKKYFYKRSFSDESYTQGLCVLWRILDNFAWARRTINSPYTLFCSHSRYQRASNATVFITRFLSIQKIIAKTKKRYIRKFIPSV